MKAYILVLIAAAVALPAYSQYEEGTGTDGIYGYTSIDYDLDSNTVTGYSETDIDTDLLPYYEASVGLSIVDAQGNWQYPIYNNWSGDAASYSNTQQINANAGQTYTAEGYHSASFVESECMDYDCYTYQYWDPYNFLVFEYEDLDEWASLDFFGPGPDNTTDEGGADLGTTFDSASVSTPPACGDVRDTLITEYRQYHSVYQPQCADFVFRDWWNNTYGYLQSYFGWYDLITDQTTAYPNFAVMQPYAYVTGLNTIGNWVVPSGLSYQLTSAYRNPAAEWNAAINNNTRYAPSSRHMAGDGADIKTNYPSGSIFQEMMNDVQAAAAQACVEDAVDANSNHVHVDWRTKTGPGNNWGGTDDWRNPTAGDPNGCPKLWSYW